MGNRLIPSMNRRAFGKGALFAGVSLAGVGWSGLTPNFVASEASAESGYETFRNACPRNCYDTCAQLTYVKNGVVKKIVADPTNEFTGSGTCVKGYVYSRRIYDPDRVKYPMFQSKRGSGKWKRISWDEAFDRIANKILDIKKRDGSTLGIGMTKYSGNFGITHWGVEGMMSSIGYTTRFVGTPCWPAGIDAQTYDMGNMEMSDPEEFSKAKYIILWGSNAAWMSVHTMKYIYQARENGAKVVTINPYLNQTAAKSDLFVEIKTSMDGALALAMGKYMIENNLHDPAWLEANSVGFSEYERYVSNEISYDWASRTTGVPVKVIRQLAHEYATAKPAQIWIGYGFQRHVNGGQNTRAVDALGAITGNVGTPGGGVQYGHLLTWGFNYHALVQSQPAGSVGRAADGGGPKGEFDTGEAAAPASYTDRTVNINKTAQEILDAKDPPLRMMWTACKNVFSQDFDKNKMIRAFTNPNLELVVTVDQFISQTGEYSDLVLPCTISYEDWDVMVSYWHRYISINQQAIKPMGEAKSDVEIAMGLSEKMNAMSPGSCTFPTHFQAKEWMEKEFNEGIHTLFGIKDYTDLISQGSKKAKMNPTIWSDKKFKTPSGKFELYSETALSNGFPAIASWVEPRKPYGKYQLLTPHAKWGIHSQFQNVDWTMSLNPEPFVYIGRGMASSKGIKDGDLVKVFNRVGEVKVRARVTTTVPDDVIVMYEAWFNKNPYNVENVVDDESSDMGKMKTGAPGVAIHDQYADVVKI